MSGERSPKRQRTSLNDESGNRSSANVHRTTVVNGSGLDPVHQSNQAEILSLNRAISPPPGLKLPKIPLQQSKVEQGPVLDNATMLPPSKTEASRAQISDMRELVGSPITLTRIRDLPKEHNIDTVSLSDVLEDPMIREVWIFNYLFDIAFIMSHLDADVRDSVKVKIVHGSWRREDTHRIAVEADAKRYDNVQVITAHMPEMFGTHHSKAMIMLRHDELAQVVIHTANMIPQDWTNLTQAVWRSPLLPLRTDTQSSPANAPVGSGLRFKIDLLNYLNFYGSRTKALTDQLKDADFSEVRAALVASVPCRQPSEGLGSEKTRWGWSGLRHVLRHVPASEDSKERGHAQIVVQISSIATLAKEKWFDPFLRTLATTAHPAGFESPGGSSTTQNKFNVKPDFHIIFPTADEVRRSLDGYASGASIHMKLESKAMQSQLDYMRPLLSHWAGDDQDGEDATASITRPVRQAFRRRAAPHIKTYIRFTDSHMNRINWALLTSANMSKQAWGETVKQGKDAREIRIASYELGVLVWPALFVDHDKTLKQNSTTSNQADSEIAMVPVFGQSMPGDASSAMSCPDARKVVGFRMPYDLPLVPYSASELPWCATADHNEPDWKGRTWQGRQHQG